MIVQNWCSDVRRYVQYNTYRDLFVRLHCHQIVYYDPGSTIGELYLVLFVITGVPAMVPSVAVDDNTININGNIVTLTLSWGEPFNNLDSIVIYTVSCSGDITCDFITDNTTRSYTITNLTPMTNYIFSVVATNSIGSGEAGVLMITTPSEA